MLTVQPSNILIIADYPENITALLSLLQEVGYGVWVEKTGDCAIKILPNRVPDLILLTFTTPELDSFETCRHLKISSVTQDIPVIFLTALSQPSERVKAFQLGAVDYITQPFHPEEVLARIETHLKLRQRQKQLEDQNQQLQTEALQQSRSLLAGVLNSSLDGVAAFEAIRDAQGKIVDFKCLLLNPAAEKILGRKGNKLLGKQLLVELPKLCKTPIIEQFISVINTGKTQETELNYTAEKKTICLQIVAVKLGDGFTVTFRDITQRKQAEEALRESEARFRGIFENAAIAIGISEADGTLIAVNPTYEAFLGYSEAEMLGRTFAEITHPDDITTERLLTQDVINGVRDSFQIEKRYLDKNGEIFWARLTLSSVRHSDGTFLFIVAIIEDINDIKLREIILRESERRFRAIFNNSFQMTTLLKPSGIVIETNQTALDFGGIKRTDVTGRFFWETGWWRDKDGSMSKGSALKATSQLSPKQAQLKQAIQKAASSQFVRYEVEIRGFGNLIATIDFSINPVLDEKGNVVLLIAEGRDISERKRVEEELKKSEERWQLVLKGNNDGIWDWNIKTNKTFRSSRWLEILGYQDDELGDDNQEWMNRLHPEDVDRVSQIKQDYLNQKIPNYMVEYRLQCKNGSYKWVLGRGQAVWDEAGNPIRMVGSNTDISDRKQVELEITTAKTALEQQIQRVLLQKRITQEIRSSLNPQQVFQIAAKQIGKAFGVNRCLIHTYIDRPIPRIPCVAEYKQPEFESIVSLEIPVMGNPHVQQMLTQDSAIVSDNIYVDALLTEALPLCQQLGLKSMLAVRTSYQGKPNGAIGIHQYDGFRQWTPDEIELLESVAAQLGIAIAQANLLQQEKQRRRELALQNHALEKAKLEAEAANQAKSQFLSKMSHELRTPLNAILGFTQVMAHDNSLTTQQLDYLNIINRSGEHLLSLINDILSMSKIEAGQVTLKENCFNLYDLLNELEQMLQLKVSSKGLRLVFERSPDLPHCIKTDESKLRQVLINLLGNAIKFTQTGSVTLRASRDGKTVPSEHWTIKEGRLSASQPVTLRFEVEDTGFGIAPEELSTLFDPFVQTLSGRQSMEGTGLGLPISQQFVHLMGGDITASSIVGQGSIFTFDIQVDLATSADQQPLPLSSQRRVIGLEPDQPSYRILIVEDAAVNRKLLVKILEPLGFEVRTAVNGQEGVALWESWSPDLIWMDVIMPVMDGYQATQRIKQTARGHKTVIIALTAGAFEEQQDALLKAGCDDVLPKPFQREVLLEKMANHLGVRYRYDKQKPSTSSTQAFRQTVSIDLLTPEVLTVMPVPWLSQLHQAALSADDDLMNQLIEQIPSEHDILRQTLQELLDNFRLDRVIDLTQQLGHE